MWLGSGDPGLGFFLGEGLGVYFLVVGAFYTIVSLNYKLHLPDACAHISCFFPIH